MRLRAGIEPSRVRLNVKGGVSSIGSDSFFVRHLSDYFILSAVMYF